MNRTQRPQVQTEQLQKIERTLRKIDRAVRPPASQSWPPKFSPVLPQ